LNEENQNKECPLEFIQDLHSLPLLRSLSLQSKQGFKREDNCNQLLSDVFGKMAALEQLTLLSLKDFRSDDFLFVTKLKNVKRLAIGSCRHWFDSNHVPFKCLQSLDQLQELRLQDILLDSKARALNETLETLSQLESLQIDNLRIEPSVGHVLEDFSQVLRSSSSLKKLTVSSNDPQTNAFLADLLKKLDNCEKLLWKVDTLVEDSGECLVPFKKASEDTDQSDDSEDPKLMDLCFLNEVIQSELSHALVEIIPQ